MAPRFGWHYNRSLASRVTLLATMAVGISVALVAVAAYFTVRHQLQSTLDDSLYRRATEAASSPALSELTANDVPPWMVGAADVKIGFITSDGRIVEAADPSGQPIPVGKPELAVARGEDSYSCRTIHSEGGDYRVATVPASDDGVALMLAQSLANNQHTLDKLGFVMFAFGALGVIAAALAGWAVARNGLRPVRRLTEAAEDIARTEQLDPIEVEGNDEIARLATAFNAMLAALSASRDRQRQLVADAGHELRTPLTSLRTNLDLLTQADARGGLSPESRAELMDDVRFQIEELTTLIGDLTELARDEPTPVTLEPVDLAEVVDRAVERVRRRASSLHYDVRTEPWWVTGEAAALERAATNLLDNAAKWSPPLGVVTVRLVDGGLTVADQGQGIAEADLPHVFDRFYRSQESRTMPGSGLGLSIVRQIVERHGGDVRAGRSADGGAELRITLPGSSEPVDDTARQDGREHDGRRPEQPGQADAPALH
jgi:two-component system, OmpR family, sensor histidine kinase MprB